MTLTEAAVLGLVQGTTEFLPISSTAHLRITPAFLGWKDAGAAFTAVLQLGTLVAILGFFLPDFYRMARGLVGPNRRSDPDAQRLLQLVVGTVPIGIAGIAFKDAIEGPLRSLWVIAGSLISVGIVMAVTERRARPTRGFTDTRLADAVLVGLAQALALVPGVSRSGITLVAAMALGLQREAAARYSFLLGVPAIAAAGIFELPTVLGAQDLAISSLVVGLVVAAVSGYASIAWLLSFLKTRSTAPFVVYRISLGVLLLLGIGFDWLRP